MSRIVQPYAQELRHLDFHSWEPERFVDDLGIQSPAFADARALTQLRYLAYYVSNEVMGCRSLLVEEHYIDRDHMEDHSVFYSRNLFPYANYCRRIHFFTVGARDALAALERIRRIGAESGPDALQQSARAFATSSYLGFAVIKPLSGSPVGRTVLRTFPPEKTGHPDYRRVFECTRDYTVHVAGVPLVVRGLPFQEQDKAVAACATTALWSALHGARAFEDIAPFTPAQITALASRSSLPFGRAMPSEGLSVDQMCQAVQAVGVSPVLRKAKDFSTARALLYSSIRSGVAPVLIVTDGSDWHAVAATGMGLRTRELEVVGAVRDVASLLEAIYIHDDRIGPYLRADIHPIDETEAFDRFGEEIENTGLRLHVEFEPDAGPESEEWLLSHILFPMHAKTRITFGELLEIAIDFVAAEVKAYRDAIGRATLSEEYLAAPAVNVETWITRSYLYQQSLIVPGSDQADLGIVIELVENVSLSRYVGVISISSEYFDKMDILIDTTSTDRNIHAIAILVHYVSRDYTAALAAHLAKQFRCALLVPETRGS